MSTSSKWTRWREKCYILIYLSAVYLTTSGVCLPVQHHTSLRLLLIAATFQNYPWLIFCCIKLRLFEAALFTLVSINVWEWENECKVMQLWSRERGSVRTLQLPWMLNNAYFRVVHLFKKRAQILINWANNQRENYKTDNIPNAWIVYMTTNDWIKNK